MILGRFAAIAGGPKARSIGAMFCGCCETVGAEEMAEVETLPILNPLPEPAKAPEKARKRFRHDLMMSYMIYQYI